jgi:crotonobetainyl-CoA:carnitine CoA-transferase CaiB-like acyl-CoA transferase
LASARVLDVGGADSDAVSRLLGDLGVDVLKIEWRGGAPVDTEQADHLASLVSTLLSEASSPNQGGCRL